MLETKKLCFKLKPRNLFIESGETRNYVSNLNLEIYLYNVNNIDYEFKTSNKSSTQ